MSRDKDYYDYMLGIVDLTKKRSTDDEAMFVLYIQSFMLLCLSKGEKIKDIKHYMDMRFWICSYAMKIQRVLRPFRNLSWVNISYLVLQAVVMWGNGRQMEFVRDARILRRNFVIDLLSY
ncbi:hypothetical protein Zm00014a_018623 [Zea mays]|uniref:Uncharacterized protein n=1 Tax=Zea mays TaxID=4577 RepID=A0A3L6F6V0_MAIZE|nr:hypothetical protein Zm00014a_018623 [Zea mays]